MQISAISGVQHQMPYYQYQSYANANPNQNQIHHIGHSPKLDVYKQLYPQGITLSWNVNAYVENTANICTKIKSICKRKPKQEYSQATDPRINNFYQYYNRKQTHQPRFIEPKTKQILNNGKIKF